MFRSFFRDKRGVSEVVSSLMMILLVATAGTILYAYSTSTLSSSGSSFQQATAKKEELARERLLITTVWWNISTEYMNVTVLNYGKIELSIDAVYIDGTQVSAATYTDGRGETIGKGSIVSVKFTSPVSLTDGQTYEIITVTERGSRDVVYWEA